VRKICNHPYLIQGAESGIKKDSENEDNLFNIVRSSSKMVLLDKLLPKLKKEGKRVLIFSQFTSMLDIIEDYLFYIKFRYVRLDGAVSRNNRQSRIDEFMNPNSDLFIFLISTKAGGVGINLQISDTVIIFDRLFIHYLIYLILFNFFNFFYFFYFFFS
jgi:SNF2 family DNA or RNA helicase